MHHKNRSLFDHNTGFSLLELMIVISIISLMAAWSYPNYIRHVQRTECRMGQIALHQLANRMEHYATLHGNYLGANKDNMNIAGLEQRSPYHFSISELSAHNFTLIATIEQDSQLHQCQTLSLNSTQTTTDL